MKIHCDMVISPNGYISRLDGTEDWLAEANWDDFLVKAKRFGNIVIGRETYENVMKFYKDYNFDNIDTDHKIIVTRNRDYVCPKGYELAHGPEEAIRFLERKDTATLFLSGGGKLNAEFAQLGLIDELELTVEPYVLGEGRPVFASGDFEFELELVETKALPDGRVKLLYRVKK